jgi:alpha-1,3-rhamnosyltransferase
MPEISVLVPSYNHSPFIERTLRSIFGQTVHPKKLIVIDDGSKDESVEVIGRVLKECQFDSELIARENHGLCSTLNEGLAKTESEYFAYLGSDDVWLPTFLEEQIALLEMRPNAVLAFSHAYVIDEDDNIIDRTDNWTAFADGDMLPVLLRGEIFSSPGVVYRRRALEKYGWNENAVLEDYELYLNLSFEGEFARNTNILCAWRQHASNTSDDFPMMLNEQIAAQNRIFDRLKISREELDSVQTELKFRSVANYLRSGYKREAWPLFWNNLPGAESGVDVAKTFLRLSVPQGIFQWNRIRKRRDAIAKYGKLDL